MLYIIKFIKPFSFDTAQIRAQMLKNAVYNSVNRAQIGVQMLTLRYFWIPSHGSPNAEFSACRVQLCWPWHSYLTTCIELPAWQFVSLTSPLLQICFSRRPYAALRISMKPEPQSSDFFWYSQIVISWRYPSVNAENLCLLICSKLFCQKYVERDQC